MSPLVVEKVTKRFGQGERSVMALSEINLEVRQGRFLAIMGASGSGKSTLLHLMAGLTRPESGAVRVNGVDLSSMSDKDLTRFRRRQIGLIFQAFNLIPTLTALENMTLPIMLEGPIRSEATTKIDNLMSSLGLANRKTHRPDSLSGGEQQRVAIGRALVTDPAVILADEPTGSLDSANSRSVCELLRELTAVHGRTIVMVTHEPSVAAFAQEVVILRDGKLVDRFDTDGADGPSLAVRYQAVLQ